MGVVDQPGYINPTSHWSLGLQCLIALSIGSSALVTFSFWRRRWPKIYAARTFNKTDLPPLRNSIFGWITDTIKVGDREVLRFAGLDAYVYLMFFRAAITVLWKLSLVSLFFIAPLHWYYLGQFDDNDEFKSSVFLEEKKRPNLFGDYTWVSVVSTYIFTVICLLTMQKYTNEVVMVRQAYLGHQGSITDRTLRISGIPRNLRSVTALKQYFESLFGAEPSSVVLCRNWENLDRLFEKRDRIIRKLEDLWASYIGADNLVFTSASGTSVPSADVASLSSVNPGTMQRDGENMPRDPISGGISSSNGGGDHHEENAWENTESGGLNAAAARLFPDRKRPVGRVNGLGVSGSKVDLLDYYGSKLMLLDEKIADERAKADTRPVTDKAFVTMKTVAHCQLAAQTIFSPVSHVMVNYLAPSPKDIIWQNVYLNTRHKVIKNYIISVVVLITTTFFAYPLTYLAGFLDVNTIRKHFPTFGSWLAERAWMKALVTDILPTFVFSSFNLVIPYLFAWLSRRQGFISKGDVELSTVAKNFFFVFINLFLIFTIESTFFSFSVDKVAKDFAYWLRRLSSFYTNLIVLQGIGLTPLKLLQPGSLFNFQFLAAQCRTARDLYELYKPQKINYGIVLPTPLFIFIVTLTYSILQRRILLFGLIYFVVSYFVFKYQLLYSMVHPQHSNAQLWAVILRRVYLGIGVFHLGMIGTLVLQSEYRFSMLILPLSVLLIGFWYDFERYSNPLLEFVAIEALKQHDVDNIGISTYQLQRAYSTWGGEPEDHAQSLDGHRQDIENGAGQQLAQPRVRQSTSTLFERVEALVSMDLSGQNDTDLSNRIWENTGPHEETLDEHREKGLEYVNKNIISPLEGPWVATNSFERVIVGSNGFERRPITYEDWL